MTTQIPKPIALIMGSTSDWPIMKQASDILTEFGVAHKSQVISAHRTPQLMYQFAKNAHKKFSVIIAGAGGAAHLPGMVASLTPLLVVGVPIVATPLQGFDSLLSIVQMPNGVPVATVAINNATNAALIALRILAINNPDFLQKIIKYQKELQKKVLNSKIQTATKESVALAVAVTAPPHLASYSEKKQATAKKRATAKKSKSSHKTIKTKSKSTYK